MLRLLLVAGLALGAGLVFPALASGAPADEWIPVRWEGGPLEVLRRSRPGFEAPSSIAPELLLQAYDPASLKIFADAPYNCLLLTWSLGEVTEADAAQREAVAGLANAAREEGWTLLAVVEPGPEALNAARSAVEAGFDGVVLDGLFSAAEVSEVGQAVGEAAAVILLGDWRVSLTLEQAPVRGSRDGVWPALFGAEDESDEFRSGPTTNPWVLANAWRIAALRAAAAGEPVWAGHRPTRYRKQPLWKGDYVRAVADAAMAGGRWVVTLDGDWQAGLLTGEPEKLAGWEEINAAVAFFEDHADWREIPPQPAVAVTLDPLTPDAFSSADMLNLLAVRHVPHRVLLRADLQSEGMPAGARGLTFDFAPEIAEQEAIQALVADGGTLYAGPGWARTGVDLELPAAALGSGGVMAYPAAELNEDQFATDLRKRLDESGATIRIFNTGTLMSHYSELGERGLLHLTEYSDYPTDNVTVRFPRKIESATWIALDGSEEELEVYDTEGGGEIVVPEVPSYCAVMVDFVAP